MEIKDSGERTQFSTGAVRDMHAGKGRMDLLPWPAIMELSKHCENGALKYGEHNCEKGIPMHSFYDSAIRHLAKWYMGWNDEDHLLAAAWNVMFLLNTRETMPEMDDIHNRQAIINGIQMAIDYGLDISEEEKRLFESNKGVE